MSSLSGAPNVRVASFSTKNNNNNTGEEMRPLLALMTLVLPAAAQRTTIHYASSVLGPVTIEKDQELQICLTDIGAFDPTIRANRDREFRASNRFRLYSTWDTTTPLSLGSRNEIDLLVATGKGNCTTLHVEKKGPIFTDKGKEKFAPLHHGSDIKLPRSGLSSVLILQETASVAQANLTLKLSLRLTSISGRSSDVSSFEPQVISDWLKDLDDDEAAGCEVAGCADTCCACVPVCECGICDPDFLNY